MFVTSYQSGFVPLKLKACLTTLRDNELKTLVVMERYSLYLPAVILGNTCWSFVPVFFFFLLFTHFLYMHILIILRVLCAEFGQRALFSPMKSPVDLLGCICRHISRGDRCRYSAVCAETWQTEGSVRLYSKVPPNPRAHSADKDFQF